jgi:nicotinic acid phosphoribosyltransferase
MSVSADVPLGLLTDRYELTMLDAALRDGTADRPCTFEVFARRLPEGRRYGVVAGTGRLVEAIRGFSFGADIAAWLRAQGVVDAGGERYLADYRFRGDVDGYPEGELYFPHSPLLTVTGTFAEAVILETLVLSILNHDAAIAAAAARMVVAAQGRPIIEMGSRRTHELAAVASARAAYLAGFASTSNLAAQYEFGIPTAGTAAHAFTLLHDDEAAAFRAQVAALGAGTTLLVDTYDITQGIATAVEVAGPSLGAIRIDSGDLGVLARHARAQLDELGATGTRIVVSRPGRGARRFLRCGHGRRGRIGRADGRARLQDGRRRWAGGGQAVRAQGDPGWPQDRLAHLQADRHRHRGGHRRLGWQLAGPRRCPRPAAAADPVRRAGGRPAGPGRIAGAPARGAGQPAVGRAEALARGARDPDPPGSRTALTVVRVRRPRCRSGLCSCCSLSGLHSSRRDTNLIESATDAGPARGQPAAVRWMSG